MLETQVKSDGSLVYVWHAKDQVPDLLGNFLYEYTVEAYTGTDGTGQLVNKATGQVWLGVDAREAVTGQVERSPTKVTFVPPAGVPANAVLRLRYRTKASDDASATAVDDQLGSATRPYKDVAPPPQLINGQWIWDATAINTGTPQLYEYVAEYVDPQGNASGRSTGTFRIGDSAPAGVVQLRATYSLGNSEGIFISRSQAYNAFGEVRYEVDGRGNRRDVSYNTLGLLTEKLDAEVAVTAQNGYVSTARAATRQLYSLGGLLVRQTDANGNTTSFGYAANGNGAEDGNALLLWEHHADNGRKVMAYDEFGLMRTQENELHQVTRFDYDEVGRLQTLTRPAREAGTPGVTAAPPKQTYRYDSFNRRIAVVNEVNVTSKTFYDAAGRVRKTVDGDNIATTVDYTYVAAITGVGGYQVGGWRRVTTIAAGTVDAKTMTEDNDYFGHNVARADFGNHTFTYVYDLAGHLKLQTGSSGQNISYDYYANGYIKEIRDNALGVVTSFTYDKDGNRTSEFYRSIVTALRPVEDVYEQSIAEYDAMNRVKSVHSTAMSFTADINYEYDAVSNVRRIRSEYRDGQNGGTRVQDLWYAYDKMNRFTVTQGTLSLNGGDRPFPAFVRQRHPWRGRDGGQRHLHRLQRGRPAHDGDLWRQVGDCADR